MKKIFKKVKFLMSLNSLKPDKSQDENNDSPGYLTVSLAKNLEIIQSTLGNSCDIVVREFSFGHQARYEAALVFVDGLVDKTMINEGIVKPLMYDTHLMSMRELPDLDINLIKRSLLAMGDVKEKKALNDIIAGLLYGSTILLIQGFATVLDIDTKGWKARSVEEPNIEKVVRGPREGFTETIRVNTALLRRKIQNPNFITEQMTLGTKTSTRIVLAYIKGLASPPLLAEVRRRLKLIKTDVILESGYIEQFIEDAPFSPFATVGNSEKPDRVAARILEGRVAILVDGTPFVLTVPMLFVEGFQAAEDYYSRPYYTSFIRLIRFLAFILALLSPALYVALESFHPELIPTPLLITMAAAEGTPFPAVIEALGMGIVFEILREGGIRLPATIGPALSIVGALIIGDAAVSAGLIGAPMVIVTAITAVSSFLVVSHTDATTLLRFALIIMAGILGLYGIGIGIIAILLHLCAIRSFGIPYLAPLTPINWNTWKDSFIRAPLQALLNRKALMSTLDPERQTFRLDLKSPEKR